MVSIGPKTVSNIRQVETDKVVKFIKLLKGQKVLSVRRRAKLLIFDLSGPLSMLVHHPTSPRLRRTGDSISLLVHLKMTGQFIYEDKKLREKTGGRYRILNRLQAPLVQLPCSYTHVIFYFTDGSILYFNDMRQFGYLKLVRDDELEHVRELNEFGPEPFSKIFTLNLFLTAVKNRMQSSIKQVLMDPKVVAGIGNIYSDEILFQAKVRPDRKVMRIEERELRNIHNQIRPVLKKGIEAKGSSVGDFVRTDGSWGTMGKFHFVYGRKGQPCKVCGTIIVSTKLGGRTSSYCPRCQA